MKRILGIALTALILAGCAAHPEKQAIEVRYKQDKATVPIAPKTEVIPPQPSNDHTPVRAPLGIDEDLKGPFRSQEAKVNNGWHGLKDGQYVHAFAGHVPGQKPQGVLWIIIERPDGSPGKFERYDTPSAAGTIRVVSADGFELVLQAENGEMFLFDVATRRYVTMK